MLWSPPTATHSYQTLHLTSTQATLAGIHPPRAALKARPLGAVERKATRMADVEADRRGAGKRRGGGAYGYGPAEAVERAWTPWLVPLFVVACVAVFVVEMYVNNCPARPQPYGPCVARFLHRFSFQAIRQNPLLGPSSST
ncbi:hypothetical protein BHE74_00023209 [Ensete ventricosum]|nr:hypothetical protein BHE74_00023209 [Ensete ventricosum]RZS01681.1 hypothetical protein BHM03_00031586 [Ensete ventricosum]